GWNRAAARAGPGRFSHRLALQLRHRFTHHLDVEVVADGSDVTRLALAEEVAGPPDLEVAHGDLEPRTELGGLADRLQPLVGVVGERVVARVEQVRVRAAAGAPDAAAQLGELPEPAAGGEVDPDGV